MRGQVSVLLKYLEQYLNFFFNIRIIRIWSTTTRTQTIIDESSQSDGVSCAYSSNGEFIFIGTRNGQIDVYKSPQIVERLVDICRRMVNQLIERENISKLNLPNDLENFLCYDDQKIILNSNSKITQKPLSNSNLPKVYDVTCY